MNRLSLLVVALFAVGCAVPVQQTVRGTRLSHSCIELESATCDEAMLRLAPQRSPFRF